MTTSSTKAKVNESKKVKGKKEKDKKEKVNPLHKDYSLLSNLRFIFGNMFREEKSLWILIPIGIFVSPVMQYLWTFMSKLVLDIISKDSEWGVLLPLCACFLGIQIFSTMMNTFYWSNTWYRYVGVRMTLMTMLNKKAMTVNFEHLENSDVMEAFQKAQNSSGGNEQGVEGMMRTGVETVRMLAVAIVGFAIMGTLHPLILVTLFITAGLSCIANDRVSAYTKRTVWDVLSSWWRKNNYVYDTCTDFKAAKDIRMFHLSGWLLDKKRELGVFRVKMQWKNEKAWLLFGIFDRIMWTASQIVIYWFIVDSVVKGKVTVGNAYLYVSASGAFYSSVSSVFSNLTNLRQRSREVSDFRSFLDFEGGSLLDGTLSMPDKSDYEITFEHVYFKYAGAEKYALEDMNLVLHKGERLAVVGMNGAGKSTFIKLLLRLYEPTKGRILLDGVDIKDYKRYEYYHRFAPLFQEVQLFAFPLKENISMNTPEATDAVKAEDCLVCAGFGEQLKGLKNGIDTEVLKIIDEEGVDFSGGERQKLALARALYKDSPVVVLDEPTAALDALAEYELYQNFDSMIGEKSAIYISHRLSSTRFCNHVAMFQDGRMIEYGTHESLLDQNGAYAEMFRVQAQYYVDSEKAQAEEGGELYE